MRSLPTSPRAVRRLALPLGLLLFAGCVQAPPEVQKPPEVTEPVGDPVVTPAPPANPDLSGPADPAAPDIVLSRTERYLTPAGETVRAEAVGTDVEALVFDGARYLRYGPAAGTSPDARRLVLRGVPEGDYLLRTGIRYTLTGARHVDLGTAHASRPDVELLATPSVSARLSATGLHPWNAEAPPDGSVGDALQLTAVEAGGLGTLVLSGLAPGTTSLSEAGAQLRTDRGALAFPRLRGDGSDTLVLSQLAARAGGVPYRSLRAAATFSAPAYDGTGELALSAALQPLPQHPLRVDLRAAEYGAHAADVHPAAALVDTQLLVYPAPYGLAYGRLVPARALLTLTQRPGAQRDGVLDLEYGDPFPQTWDRLGVMMARYAAPLALPSGRTFYAYGFLSREDELSHFASAPVTPELLCARALRVDGADTAPGLALASLTPTVSWEAPALGTPHAYTLRVLELSEPEDTAAVRETLRGDFVLPTGARSLRLPEGVLSPGKPYVLQLTVWRASTWDFAHAPFSYGSPSSTATCVSGLLGAP